MNRALLAKWLWRYGEEPNGLWRRVIKDKYKDHGRGWSSRQPVGPYGSELWKDIYKENSSSLTGVVSRWEKGTKYCFGMTLGGVLLR